MRSIHKPALPAALVTGLCLLAAWPAAAQMQWNGTQSSSWINGANWTPAGPPGSSVETIIDTISPNDTVVNGWNVTAGPLDVGAAGTGRLSIIGGGTLDSGPGAAVVGRSAGAEGAVTVGGIGSSWTVASNLIVGHTGRGTLTIEAGGSVNNFGAFVGWLFGSAEGVVTVSGNGSTWNNAGELVISQTSPASVLVEDGATMSSVNGIIGATTGTGEVTVTGSGSAWSYAGMLAVGRGAGGGGAGGSLTIADGGQVVNTGLGDSIIGEHPGAEGVVTVAGAGTGWHTGAAGTLYVGLQGSGTLLIEDQALVTAGGSVSVADQAGSEGELRVNGILTAAGGTVVNTAARLGGDGSIGGGTTVIAGTVSPGDPVGMLSTRSLVLEDTAVLEFDLDAPGGVGDLLFVTGDLTLDGVLHVTDLGDFGAGSYLLIQYTDALNDNGLVPGSLPPGFSAVIDTATAGEVHLVVEAVPDHLFLDRFEETG